MVWTLGEVELWFSSPLMATTAHNWSRDWQGVGDDTPSHHVPQSPFFPQTSSIWGFQKCTLPLCITLQFQLHCSTCPMMRTWLLSISLFQSWSLISPSHCIKVPFLEKDSAPDYFNLTAHHSPHYLLLVDWPLCCFLSMTVLLLHGLCTCGSCV